MRKINVPRPGYTLMEVSAAMLILAIVLPMVAQLAFWSLKQRTTLQSQDTALELANNILESARARSWESLTPEWAAAQTIPSEIAKLLPGGTLAVKVEPEKNQVRRVTVSITWETGDAGPPRQLRLTTLLSPRTAIGGQP